MVAFQTGDIAVAGNRVAAPNYLAVEQWRAGVLVDTLLSAIEPFPYVQMAFDASGTLYVPAQAPSGVYRWDSGGNYLGSWGGPYTVSPHNGPASISFDSSGFGYVLGIGASVAATPSVRKFSADGTTLLATHALRKDFGGFVPSYFGGGTVTTDGSRYLYAYGNPATGGYVDAFDLTGGVQEAAPFASGGTTFLPNAVKVAATGDVLVGNNKSPAAFWRYNSAGVLQASYDLSGGDVPTDITDMAVASDPAYAVTIDLANGRVYEIALAGGAYTTEFTTSLMTSNSLMVAVMPSPAGVRHHSSAQVIGSWLAGVGAGGLAWLRSCGVG